MTKVFPFTPGEILPYGRKTPTSGVWWPFDRLCVPNTFPATVLQLATGRAPTVLVEYCTNIEFARAVVLHDPDLYFEIIKDRAFRLLVHPGGSQVAWKDYTDRIRADRMLVRMLGKSSEYVATGKVGE